MQTNVLALGLKNVTVTVGVGNGFFKRDLSKIIRFLDRQ